MRVILPFICLITVLLLLIVYKNVHSAFKVLGTNAIAPTAMINEATIMAYELDAVIITETPTPTPTPKPTKTPTPTPVPRFIPVGALDELIVKYSNKESVDPGLLKKIAVCESRLNAMAVNGPYAGLYQFSESSWRSIRTKMNLDTNPQLRFNPEESIRSAAFKLAIGGRFAWPNCGK